MRKSLYLSLFTLVMAIAYALSAYGQAQSGAAATQNSQPASESPQSSSSGAQSQTTQPPQSSASPINVPGGATDASGGGIAGSAGAPAGKTEVPETPQLDAAPISDNELQGQIQNALSKEPTLAGDTVNARVASDSIELTGSVGTAKEKLTATRIVESYAGNKKVVSHLAIGNRNDNAAPIAHRPGSEANSQTRPDRSSRPEAAKDTRTGSSTNPPE